MKDFKNKNGYGNIESEDEMYDGIILKTGDEGYRYYSEGDCSEDNTIADIIITGSYVSESSSTAKVNMSAACANADVMYIRLFSDEGTVLHSTGTSWTSVSAQKTFVSAGEYVIESEVILETGGRKVRRAPLEVKTRTGMPNRCDMCDETGWLSAGGHCTSCGAWQRHAAPIQMSYYNESESISTVTVNIAASCVNAVDMYLRIISEDGTEYYSMHASSASIFKSIPLGAGRYTLQAEAISLTGGIRIERRDINVVLTSGSASPGSVGSGSCYKCGGTGYIGSENCSVCNSKNTSYDCSYCFDTGWLNGEKCINCNNDYLGPNEIYITTSYSKNSIPYKLKATATCDNAWWMRVEVENTTFSNEASTNQVSLETAVPENGSYSIKVTAQRNGIYRYQYANVTLKNGEVSYACPPYIGFSHRVGDYNSTTGTYSVGVSVYCEDATHIKTEILNKNKALCASISGSGTSVSGLCELMAGENFAKFVIQRGMLGKIEETYRFFVNGTADGGGGAGGEGTVTTPEFGDVPDNERKFLLLYTGPGYPDYAKHSDLYDVDKICRKILESGATDFVLTTTYQLNKINENTTLLSYEGTYTGDDGTEHTLPNGLYDISDYFDGSLFMAGLAENFADVYEEYKERMKQDIVSNEKMFSMYGNTTYEIFMSSVIALTKKLVSLNSNIGIWIAFPPMMSACGAAAEAYNHAYKKYIYDVAKNNLKDCWDNVRGFYYAQEEIPFYLRFNGDEVDYQNSVIKDMAFMKNAIGNKKLLWIPYRPGNDTSLNITMDVINSGKYFDIAILQPSHYFGHDGENRDGLDWVEGELQNNIGAESVKRTWIGAEMELDGYICEMIYDRTPKPGTTASYSKIKERYYEYEAKFKKYVGKYPIAYYADIFQQVNVQDENNNYLYTFDEMYNAMCEIGEIIKKFYTE